jgi:hypothetical protein
MGMRRQRGVCQDVSCLCVLRGSFAAADTFEKGLQEIPLESGRRRSARRLLSNGMGGITIRGFYCGNSIVPTSLDIMILWMGMSGGESEKTDAERVDGCGWVQRGCHASRGVAPLRKASRMWAGGQSWEWGCSR